ncbi:hypothetical protein ACFVS2_21180 [Brevibacillus sp. NPDC058079]|uniref:hypothetical protein n=1 Tax=Brevibacillus sp. NPDC058079 TaxID=3346330 RepID=UPI0036EF0E96
MNKLINREELLLSKLKNEDKILELQQENLVYDLELAKLEMKDSMFNIPEHLLQELRVICLFGGLDFETELKKVKDMIHSRSIRDFTLLQRACNQKIEEIQIMRKNIAVAAQEILNKQNREQSQSGTERNESFDLEEVIKTIVTKKGIPVILFR